MKTYTLIVNRDEAGTLSACPTVERFNQGGFLTNPDQFLVMEVKMASATYKSLYKNRDHAHILHAQLPLRADVAGRVYYEVKDGVMKKAD